MLSILTGIVTACLIVAVGRWLFVELDKIQKG